MNEEDLEDFEGSTSCNHRWIAGECFHCGKLARAHIEELEVTNRQARELLLKYDAIADLVPIELGNSKVNVLEQFVRLHLGGRS